MNQGPLPDSTFIASSQPMSRPVPPTTATIPLKRKATPGKKATLAEKNGPPGKKGAAGKNAPPEKRGAAGKKATPAGKKATPVGK